MRTVNDCDMTTASTTSKNVMSCSRRWRRTLLLSALALGCVLLLALSAVHHAKSPYCTGADCDALSSDSWRTFVNTKMMPVTAKEPFFNITSKLSFNMPKNEQQIITQLYDYIDKPQTDLCQKMVKIGGQADYKWRHLDGHKWACLDERYGLLKTWQCLVYSLGVDHDWSFDDNVQLLRCEVHAFDPSLGQSDHRRSPRIFFHNLGISDRDGKRSVNGRFWQMRTYGSLLKQLGHLNRTIHYLKVDVEGAEWPMFAQIVASTPQLLQNVEQLGVEIHMKVGGKKRASTFEWSTYLKTMISLERAGFRLFHTEVNPYEPAGQHLSWTKRKVSGVYELVWLRAAKPQ